MEVFLIRHTRPEIPSGICYGQTDIPLKDTFPAESKLVLSKLPKFFDTVFTSPSMRCLKLANLISSGGTLKQDSLLKELNFGDWEMKAWDDIPKEELNPWMSNFVTHKVPNGEAFSDLIQRVDSFLEQLKNIGQKQVALVCHAGIIRAMLVKALNIPSENAFRLSIDYGSVSKLSYSEGRFQVDFFNR
tara:strand:- start:215 stop:778 length:564 start_codon:yes stop_codon:yes gene_type:complete